MAGIGKASCLTSGRKSGIDKTIAADTFEKKNIKEMYTGTSVSLKGTVYNSSRKKIKSKRKKMDYRVRLILI